MRLLSSFARSLSYMLFLLVMVTASLQAYANDEDQQAKLKALKTAMEELRKELEAAKGSRDSLLKELESTEKNVGNLSEKAKKLEKQLEERQEKLQDLNDERSELNGKKKNQQEHVASYINAAYRLGQQSNIRLLLNQEDPSRVSRNLKYYDRFITARSEKIQTYVETINRLNQIEPEIQYERQRLKTEVTDLKQKRDKLSQAQKNRKATLNKLNSNIQSQDQKLAGMKIDRGRLEKLLNRVSTYIKDVDVSAKNSNFKSMRGKLPWPTKGKLAKRFGSSRVENKMKWEGWLIKSKPGNPVKAVHHGQVVFSDYLRGHGLLVIVDHGKGYLSLYAHNQALYKELGEWVDQGETIATVGDSGGLNNHALYFELRHKGKPINPKPWLSKSA